MIPFIDISADKGDVSYNMTLYKDYESGSGLNTMKFNPNDNKFSVDKIHVNTLDINGVITVNKDSATEQSLDDYVQGIASTYVQATDISVIGQSVPVDDEYLISMFSDTVDDSGALQYMPNKPATTNATGQVLTPFEQGLTYVPSSKTFKNIWKIIVFEDYSKLSLSQNFHQNSEPKNGTHAMPVRLIRVTSSRKTTLPHTIKSLAQSEFIVSWTHFYLERHCDHVTFEKKDERGTE